MNVTGDESGTVTDRYSYDGYGNLLDKKGNTENDFLYTGEQYNYLTELYYLRARYMNPSTGTFISMDSYAGTIYDPVSLHKYLYANANPVMYRDPSGYMSMTEMAGSLAISAILTYSLATVFLHMMHVKVEEVPIIGDFYRLNRDVEDFIEVIKVEKEARIVIEVFPKLVFIKELFEVIYKTEFDFRNIEIFPAIEKKGPTILTIETSYGKSSSISGADNIADVARLKEYYKQAEKYGTGSIKELENGRFRFYEEIKPARTNGEMAGARHVREWDPYSGLKRDWYETIDHNGNIRQVRPDPNITGGVKVHYMFDPEGKYIGKWSPE